MVFGELGGFAIAQQIGARITDLGHGVRLTTQNQRGQRGQSQQGPAPTIYACQPCVLRADDAIKRNGGVPHLGRAVQDAAEELPDAQSDLFALGVTLYQLLTTRLPYGEVLPYQAGRYYRDPVAPSRINPEVPIWLDHIVLKAVARDKRQRFETAEELLLALERGASRPLTAPHATPLLQRDPTAVWKMVFAVSVLVNLLLVYWLVFLPR